LASMKGIPVAFRANDRLALVLVVREDPVNH
jgi:hypothetical protein